MKKRDDSFQLYIGVKGNPPDKFTKDNIYIALQEANISTEFEGKKLNGVIVKVWKVTPEFVSSLYNLRASLPLKFVVYADVDSIFQQFCLRDPRIKKKARQMRYLKTRISDEM